MPAEVAGRRGAGLEGHLGGARGVLVGQVANVVVGRIEIQGQAADRQGRRFELQAARAHIAGIGQVLGAVGLVVGIGLVAVDHGPEQVAVEDQAVVEEGGLQPQLGIVGALGANQQRVGTGAGSAGHGQVDAAGFLAVGQRGVAQNLVAEAVAEAEQSGRTDAVQADVAAVVGADPAVARGRRRAAHRGAAERGVAFDPGGLFLVGAAHAGGEVQALG
ncbi:Uncharacterised protein [Acinetobacter baumannii]|nr:Uncharacterised protein [Acinetobacter baumannii]